MAYLDNLDKVRGAHREPIIDKGLIDSLRKLGYKASSMRSTLHEDQTKKIDRWLEFDPMTPFLGLTRIPIDIKSGQSYTLITTQGRNCIKESKASYLVYEYSEYNSFYILINVPRLRECLEKNPPVLRNSKYNTSKYFFITNYMASNKAFFNEKEYLRINK